jgi:hypothetical protein
MASASDGGGGAGKSIIPNPPGPRAWLAGSPALSPLPSVGSIPPPAAPRRAGRRSASTAALSRIVSPWPSPERTSRRPGVTTVGPVVVPFFSPAPTVTPSSIRLSSLPARPAGGAFDADDRSASFPKASASAPFDPPSAAPSAYFRTPALRDRSGTPTAAMFPCWSERALGAPSRSSARDGGGSAAPSASHAAARCPSDTPSVDAGTASEPSPAADRCRPARPPRGPADAESDAAFPSPGVVAASPNPLSATRPWWTESSLGSAAGTDHGPSSAPGVATSPTEPPSYPRPGWTASSPTPVATDRDAPRSSASPPSDPRRRGTASSPWSAAATDRDPAPSPRCPAATD